MPDVPVSSFTAPEATTYSNTYNTVANELYREEFRSGRRPGEQTGWALALLWTAIAARHPPQSSKGGFMDTIWQSPTDFVTGDPSLVISYPYVSHPSTVVTCSVPGDLKWVSMGLRLPSNAIIDEVIISYEVSSPQSFIAQTRLAEMKTPDHATVLHDDPTQLQSTSPASHNSIVTGAISAAAVTLARLNFTSTADQILLGAVGVRFRRAAQCIETIADLKQLNAGAARCLAVLGYYTAGDGGGGTFYWDASAIEEDNGGTLIAPASNPAVGRWKRMVDGPLSVKWFGAKGDNIQNDHPGIQAAVKAAAASVASNRGTVLFFPPGEYNIRDSIVLPRCGWLGAAPGTLLLRGSGIHNTSLTDSGYLGPDPCDR